MRSLWRRLETCLEQHLAHRRRRDRNTQTLELADDPFVPPVRVLPSETKDQLTERALERRSPGPPLRVGPAARDQLAVPAKQRLRLEREGRPGGLGQRAARHRQERTICWCWPRPWGLPTEDRQLMAEDENLQLLRATRPPQSHTSANRFRTTRYINDQSKQPSLDHDRAPNLASPARQESRGRVCEPYAIYRDRDHSVEGLLAQTGYSDAVDTGASDARSNSAITSLVTGRGVVSPVRRRASEFPSGAPIQIGSRRSPSVSFSNTMRWSETTFSGSS